MITRVSFMLILACLLAACGGQPRTPVEPTPAGRVEAVPSATAPSFDKPQPTVQGEAGVPPLGCASPAAATPAMTEGPYYKAGSPERTSLLEADTPGTRLVLTGYVLTTDCQPVANAWLDFWQTDGNGAYDNAGFKLRGQQYTDENGRYTLETVIPGLYPGRTAHIHVKVQAPQGPVLTTQLFFPGVNGNVRDSIFAEELLVALEETEQGMRGRFDFVVEE